MWAFAPEGIELVLNTRASVGTRPRRTLVDVHLAVEAGVARHTLTRVRVWIIHVLDACGAILAGPAVARSLDGFTQRASSVCWADALER